MNKLLARNALANVLQTVASAGLLFALYRYINTRLGVDQLGVWSVVLATVSTSRLADMGLSAGVIRFVARDRARGELDRAAQVIDTAVLTLMGFVGLVLPLAYPVIAKLLPLLFKTRHLAQALRILPYALVSLWLTIIGAVFQGGLDGCQRMDLRAGLVVAGQALFLMLAFWEVPKHGLVGLAWAQVGQGLILVVLGRLLLRRALPTLPGLPQHWRKHVLREMLTYGLNLQAATLFMLLLDPVAKALTARFGGPTAAGYFEMANQVVVKARSLIDTANRALVPHVAALAEADPSRLGHLYRENLRMLALVALPLFALLFAWAGGFSWLLAGTYRPEFVALLGLFALGWGINIFCVPAYFTNMGTGHVGWNTFSHIVMGVLNVALGYLLGRFFGTFGVACAYAMALAAGGGILIIAFQQQAGAGWGKGVARDYVALVCACAVVVAFAWAEPLRPSTGTPGALAVGLVMPPLILGLAIWFHPARRRLLGRLMSREARAQ